MITNIDSNLVQKKVRPEFASDESNETSCTADISPLIVQQRKILDLMGLDIWVRRNLETQYVEYDAIADQNQPSEPNDNTSLNPKNQNILTNINNLTSDNSTSDNLTSDNLLNASAKDDEFQDAGFIAVNLKDANLIDSNLTTSDLSKSNEYTSDLNESKTNQQLRYNPIKALKQKIAKDSPKAKTIGDNLNKNINVTNDNKPETIKVAKLNQVSVLVEPFEIIAAAYNEWIILVDAKVLKNQAIATLWQNLLNALSLTPQSLKFPICEGISDQESANASLAGFLFNISKNENANIAALSPMPDGTTHSQLKRVPYLSEMIEDNMLKKKLWQTLNQ